MLIVIGRVLPDCVDAGLFLVAYILFSVWIATSTFDKGPEHQSPYMRDFKETLWTLMVARAHLNSTTNVCSRNE